VSASVVGEAVAAAVAVAAEQGLRVADAIPVGTGSNVIVHLRPSPIVARVMCGTVVLHPDPHAWLTREIDVAAFLAERITSVVAPTKEIDPGPYVRGNRWMSFWEYVEVRQTPLEAVEIGRALRALHDALAEYRGPLPPRSAVLDEIDWLLNALSGDGGVSELSAERDRLAEVILEQEHATDRQPLHGDASLSNLLATSSGPRWNDFEDVCVGTIEWDLAGVLSDARAAHGDAFSAEVLAAYGGECDQAALERVDQVHALYGVLWRRYRQLCAERYNSPRFLQ
jgi:aminoglycoside phosphotransferase